MNKFGKIWVIAYLHIIITLFFVINNIEYSNAQSNNNDDIRCGDIIRNDIILSSNLYCDDEGLIISNQNGLTIDLNGYTISGPGVESQKVGISIIESENIKIVGNGTIKNFQAGISNTESENTGISNITFTENKMGIFNTGASKAEIKGNNIDSNSIGITAHSSDGLMIIDNILDSNQLAGITFVNSGESQITSNAINGSVNGIFLDSLSSHNDINNNTVLDNSGVDLNNDNGLPTNENNNSFNNNKCNASVPDGLCDNLV
ncbi:MAG: right-handed parallel beta-helix repeat-containing protein [Nitrosopumilus sp.]|nr:right-handed parallel beta-helix repeat-containing protein [Nitrosopumilus sp.]